MNRINQKLLLTILEQVEKLHHEISASAAELADLQNLYKAQSVELTSVRSELQTSMFSSETKDQAIASLTAELRSYRSAGAYKDEQVAITLKQVERLEEELSTSTSQLVELQSVYEARSHEIVAVRDELETCRQSGAKKTEELEQLRRDLATSTPRIAELQQRDEARSAQLASMRRDLEQLRSDLSTASSQLRESLQRYEAQEEKLASTHKDLERLRRESRELTAVRDELRAFQSQATKNQELYEEQLKALRSVAERPPQLLPMQRFFTVADAYGNKIIIQMLQQLNENVQLITKNMAECLVEDIQAQTASLTEEQISATQRITECIGQILTGCLGKKERNDVALHLQIAFQAYLVYHLCRIISSWTTAKEHNDLINEIYKRLQKSGGKSCLESRQPLLTVEKPDNRDTDVNWALAVPHAYLHQAHVWK